MISKRTAEMTSFIVMDVLERANEMEREGVHIIHLEVGEPDFDTPACVKEAACRALEGGHTHYTHSLGSFELRNAICEYYLKTYGVSFEPNQVTDVKLPLQDVFHTFKPGHRMMIHVQSSWFPLVDRNPQSYVENIFKAEEQDFVAATHRVYHSTEQATFLEVKILNR